MFVVAEVTVPLSLRFGLPFVLYMDRTVTWDALQKEILEKMRHLLRPGVYIQVATSEEARFFLFLFIAFHLHTANKDFFAYTHIYITLFGMTCIR